MDNEVQHCKCKIIQLTCLTSSDRFTSSFFVSVGIPNRRLAPVPVVAVPELPEPTLLLPPLLPPVPLPGLVRALPTAALYDTPDITADDIGSDDPNNAVAALTPMVEIDDEDN